MKGLHNLHPAKGSHKRSKRLGRGSGSGKGNYSGKGIKGQRARSGGRSGLQARSMKAYLLRIPKIRGFKSHRPRWQTVNVSLLASNFSDGERVTPQSLRAKHLITGQGRGVKILGQGELNKKLTVEAHSFSLGAKAAIEGSGGTATLLSASRAADKKATKSSA